MNFVTIDTEKLSTLHDSLYIIEQVSKIDTLYLYGLTSDESVIDAVKEAIAGEIDEEETEVKLAGAVAICIPLSSDILYYLTGSGLKLTTEDVAYSKGGGTGMNTISLTFAGFHPKVTTRTFSYMALAGDDMYVDSFLQKYGKTPAAPAQTTPAHPHTEVTREGVKEHTPGPGEVKKTTSSLNDKKPLSGYYGAGLRPEPEPEPHNYRGYADGSACYVCGHKREHEDHKMIDPQLIKEFLD